MASTESEDGAVEVRSQHPNPLTEAQVQRLAEDAPIRPYLASKFEKDSKRHWDIFYKHNSTHFFKDRHWLHREFTALAEAAEGERAAVLLEIGCGVGNAVFPLLEANPALFVHACDLSPRAVGFVKAHELFSEDRCNAFQCDLTADDLTLNVNALSVDFVTALFVFSAMSPERMEAAVANLAKVVKTGGQVFFRDYGIHDHAQLRFKPGHKIADNFYVRQDGTRAYYFQTEEVQQLFARHGFDSASVEYVSRQTVNKKESLSVPRVFVQGQFVKQ